MAVTGGMEPLSVNHPKLEDLTITVCYLCGRPLGDDRIRIDVIPVALFLAGSTDRPALFVHPACQRTKAKNEPFFIRQLLRLCGSDRSAKAQLQGFAETARAVRRFNYAGGQRDPENKVRGIHVEVAPETVERILSFGEQICSGLFMSNLAKPPKRNIEAIWCDYLTGGMDRILYDVDRLLRMAGKGIFRQEWGDRLRYCGTSVRRQPGVGFVYLEFFGKIGILSFFNP